MRYELIMDVSFFLLLPVFVFPSSELLQARYILFPKIIELEIYGFKQDSFSFMDFDVYNTLEFFLF